MPDLKIDRSNGYEAVASVFTCARNRNIGVATVLDWSDKLPRGGSILDVGCGNGVPITEALIGRGFDVYAIDASESLVSAFREHFPDVSVVCEPVETSKFFSRKFDGIVAIGLIFLLQADIQPVVLSRLAARLNPNGKLLFTAPREQFVWKDALTGLESRSLGAAEYKRILADAELAIEGDAVDEGENYYYVASRPGGSDSRVKS